MGLLLAVAVGRPCEAEPGYVDTLAAKGLLAIPLWQARQLEAHLGQLLIINVDGFGYSGRLALAPGYADLVARLQVGGVIPHYGSTDYERIARTNRALAGMTTLPLLICSDMVKLKGPSTTASFGDGYVGGFLGRFRSLPDAELETLARLNAFVFAAVGVNVALGPTVDGSSGDPRVIERARLVLGQMHRYGLAPVLKHFPALPAGADLHKESPDTRLDLSEVQARASAFGALSAEAGIMMTTHFYDSKVDPDIVTFSSAWIGIMRAQAGFQGLLMSDGLLMLKNYTDRRPLRGGPPARDTTGTGVDETAVWAARAIVAGHDMVILEGSAAQTTRAFNGLLALACARTAFGRTLASRIEESYGRILQWKKARAAALRRIVDVPASVIDQLIALLPGSSMNLSSFRFDPAGLSRLEPALRAAAFTTAKR